MERRYGFVRVILLFAGLALASGCSKGPSSQGESTASPAASDQQADQGEVVARVGDSVITLSDFEQQLNQQNPLIRARYKSLEQKKKLLDNLVQREAMVLEAQRLGLDKDPEVIRGYKKILARHLVNKEFNQKRVKQLEITDADIQKYYDENQDRYHAPEKVRLHLIFLAAAKGDAAARKAARAKADKLLAELKANPNDRRKFLELARKESQDQASANIGGDTNFKTRAQLEEIYGPAVAEAGFGLQKANDLSPVIATDRGFYILRQSGRQAAIDLPLDKVKGQIRTTLFARARGDAYQQFVEEIEQKVGVQTFDDVVSKAKVDTSGTGRMAPPFPGHMGPGPKAGGPRGFNPHGATMPPHGAARSPHGAARSPHGIPIDRSKIKQLKNPRRTPAGAAKPAGH